MASTPNPRVVVYGAAGCSLCERGLAVVRRLQAELGFELEEIDISGVPELEAAYREWLPVVELDGRRAFVYHLDEAALRRRLGVSDAVTKSLPLTGL